jgi:hypothetical protein
MAKTLVDCDCEASDPTDDSGIELTFCSLHAAAPDLLVALKAMVASYDGLRDALTCPAVIAKLAAADAAIALSQGDAVAGQAEDVDQQGGH